MKVCGVERVSVDTTGRDAVARVLPPGIGLGCLAIALATVLLSIVVDEDVEEIRRCCFDMQFKDMQVAIIGVRDEVPNPQQCGRLLGETCCKPRSLGIKCPTVCARSDTLSSARRNQLHHHQHHHLATLHLSLSHYHSVIDDKTA